MIAGGNFTSVSADDEKERNANDIDNSFFLKKERIGILEKNKD
jgi:hypothetical protein